MIGLWLTLACSSTPDPPPSPAVATPASSIAAPAETSPDPHSACNMKGPFHGKLQGVVLAKGLSLAAAKAKCLEIGHDCTGITATSDHNGPFTAIQANVHFIPDDSVDGVVWLRRCPGESQMRGKEG